MLIKLSKDTTTQNKEEENMQLQIFGSKYPEFRFFCPRCGTLEVFMTWQPKASLKGHCLECNNDWSEGIRE